MGKETRIARMKCLLLLTLAVFTLGQERCRAPLVPEGRCSFVIDCPLLQTMLVDGSIPDFIRNYGGCGKRNGDLMLCCPTPSLRTPVSQILNFPAGPSRTPSTAISNIEGSLPCMSPSHDIPPFGCVTLVRENKTWREARENCQDQGQILLDRISTPRELEELRTRFPDSGEVWVGLYKLQWIESRDAAPPSSSSLWRDGFPTETPGYDCGLASLFLIPPVGGLSASLLENPCDMPRWSLCQNKKY